MATMADLDRMAMAMPQTAKRLSADGRPAYLVHGKLYCCHRGRRPDAIDPATGERMDDVLMFRVADVGVKELLLSDVRGVFFTRPHFDGYPAVLMRIPDLGRIDSEELGDTVAEAWLTRAQKRVARAWLEQRAPVESDDFGDRSGSLKVMTTTGGADMRRVMVRYTVRPDQAEANEALVREVYDELDRTRPDGLRYATFRLDDGVSFVHVASVETDDGQNPLSGVQAFHRFSQ